MTVQQKEKLLQEVKRLHDRFTLSSHISADYFEPGMMEYLDQTDGAVDFETGQLSLRFEARGTRYEGRPEVIETVQMNDPVQIVRDEENPYNPNKFSLLAKKGKNIGNMPAELCNALAPLYDQGDLTIENAEVSFLEPLSKRNRHAKRPMVFISLEGKVISKPKSDIKEQKTFVIPCNPQYYQVFKAFRELKTVDWKQNLPSISEGDIVYIYVSAPISAICFKCIVKKANKPERTIDDSLFILKGDPYVPYKRHMELELIKEFDRNVLPISKLRQLGFHDKLQWAEKIPGALASKIEKVLLEQSSVQGDSDYTSSSGVKSNKEEQKKLIEKQKNTVIASIKKLFPDSTIYREQYNLSRLGVAIHHSVYKFAKADGIPVSQWLELQGFQWKETGFIEEDMIAHEEEIVTTDAFKLTDSVFRHFPLAGQYIPSESEMEMLYDRAQKAVIKMVQDGSQISFQDKAVLTLSTIQLLKNRESNTLDENGNEISFWNYIYLQYGFNPANSEIAEQRVYKKFRDAIKDTLIYYKRYIAPSNTMRYYTSLMLHAVSPKQSIDNLLDILFDFYVKNLDFQYMPNDIGYKTLVKGIQARWSDDIKNNTELKLKASEIMSGLKTLFQERPGYMAVLCDSLVMKMDLMLRGEDLALEDEWDRRLTEWFKKKSSIERSSLQNEKREHRIEYIATTSDRIFLQYGIEKGQVGFSIPRIRLSEIKEERPVLTIYQDDNEIYYAPLSVTGNDLGFTTRRAFIAFDETRFNFGGSLQLKAAISYCNEKIYSSNSKLFRKWITFDESGNERTPRNGIVFLFGTDTTEFVFADEEGITQENHPGQLLRINLNRVSAVSADGTEIFADEKQTEKIRLYPTVNPVREASASIEGKAYQLFDRPFSLAVHLPKEANKLQYQYIINGERYNEKESSRDNKIKLEIPTEPYKPNSLTIIDFKLGTITCEFCYIILPGFTCKWEKPYYLSSESESALLVSQGENEAKLVFQRTGEDDASISTQPFEGLSLSADIPTLRCEYKGIDAFHLPRQIWVGDIEKEAFISISSPNTCKSQLMLGTLSLPQNVQGDYEIGNYLKSGKQFSEKEPLWISVTTPDNQVEHHLITTVYMKPAFLENPIESTESGIFWRPEHKYMGSRNPSFVVKISNGTEHEFKLNGQNQNIPLLDNLLHGRYYLSINLINSGIFAKEKETVVYKGYFFVGDERELRYNGKELILSNAIYWNEKTQIIETVDMKPSAGILTDLVYLGNHTRPWDDYPLPEYRATLCYENSLGKRIPFNSDERNRDYEWINPVYIWIVNEQRLILCTAEEEIVYFDIGYSSIVNKNPNKIMTAAARYNRLKNPDYFEFQEKEAHNNV